MLSANEKAEGGEMSNRTLRNAILRQDLSAFTAKAFSTVSSGDKYLGNWHIDAVCHQLERVYDGSVKRLLIAQPPRSLKSICSSVSFVAWAIGHDPTLRIACVSYSHDLAELLAVQFRAVVESDWYREVFPGVRFKKKTAMEYTTTQGGGRLATSVGGTLTGRGADIVIIDDPMKAADAQSQSARTHVIEWYRSTLVTRLNDKRTGAIIVVMQRLHEDDLAGHLLRHGGWETLELPAIAIEPQEIPLGMGRSHFRAPGDLLHPEREPREELDRLKQELGSLAFSAQYQQRPVPADGNLIQRAWIRLYDTLPVREAEAIVVQSLDVATTTSERSDYSVCTTWLVFGKTYYLIDVWRDRLEFPALKRKVIALQESYNASHVLIEDAGLGLSLIQELAANSPDRFPKPIRVRPDGDKRVRMEAASARFEAGQVWLPKDAVWLDTLLHELLAFPHGRHDDQADSVSQFLNWQRTRRRPLPVLNVSSEKLSLSDHVFGRR